MQPQKDPKLDKNYQIDAFWMTTNKEVKKSSNTAKLKNGNKKK
jgi:hypothetical protein